MKPFINEAVVYTFKSREFEVESVVTLRVIAITRDGLRVCQQTTHGENIYIESKNNEYRHVGKYVRRFFLFWKFIPDEYE